MLWALLSWEEGDILFTSSWSKTDYLLVNTNWEILVFWKEGEVWTFSLSHRGGNFPRGKGSLASHGWHYKCLEMAISNQGPFVWDFFFPSSATLGKPTYDLLKSKKINFPDWGAFWWPRTQETHELPMKLPCTHLNSLCASPRVCLKRGWATQPFIEN